MENVVEVRLEIGPPRFGTIVDKTQLVRTVVSLIKSMGIEKEVLRILRGY